MNWIGWTKKRAEAKSYIIMRSDIHAVEIESLGQPYDITPMYCITVALTTPCAYGPMSAYRRWKPHRAWGKSLGSQGSELGTSLAFG